MLSGLEGDSGSVLLRQGSSQSSGLLGSQVLWNQLLAGVQLSDALSLVGVDDSQNSGDVSSDNGDLWHGLGDLLDLQRGQLLLQLKQLLSQLFLGLGSQFSNFNDGLDMLVTVSIIRSEGLHLTDFRVCPELTFLNTII